MVITKGRNSPRTETPQVSESGDPRRPAEVPHRLPPEGRSRCLEGEALGGRVYHQLQLTPNDLSRGPKLSDKADSAR